MVLHIGPFREGSFDRGSAGVASLHAFLRPQSESGLSRTAFTNCNFYFLISISLEWNEVLHFG